MEKNKISVSWSHDKDLDSIFTFVSLVDTEDHLKVSFCIMQDDITDEIMSLTAHGDDYRKSSYKDWTVYKNSFEGYVNKDNLAEAINWIIYDTIRDSNCVDWFDRESIIELEYTVIREISEIIRYNNGKHE